MQYYTKEVQNLKLGMLRLATQERKWKNENHINNESKIITKLFINIY